jgi:hypothetical protein
VRTNPKSGSSRNERPISRVPRRGTARSKSQEQESAALPAVPERITSEQIIPVQDDIARLAYFLWEARGGTGGSAEEDWLRAEQEILARSRS